MLKKRLLKLLLPLTLLGCEKSYPTYPILDGEYVVDIVVANYEYLNERYDTTYYDGVFVLPNPISPLDSFEVGKTRFKISYNNQRFYWNKGTNVNGSPWDNSPYAEMTLGKNVYGEWEKLILDFWDLDGTNVRRPFILLEQQSTEQFVLRMTQYPDVEMGTSDDIKFIFYKVGL